MQHRTLLVGGLALAACAGKGGEPAEVIGEAPGCATAILFVDADLDGVGDSQRAEEACVNVIGHSEVGGDCDDTDPSVNPNANEVCNGVDDDCDGTVDRGLRIEVWSDLDGDGFGDPETPESVCEPEAHHVRDASDCDDTDPLVHPDGVEQCDGIDQDCDGAIDEEAEDRLELFADLDGDGLGDPDTPVLACPGADAAVENAWDCDDTDSGRPLVVDAGASGVGSLDSPFGTIQEGVDAASADTGAACVVVLGGRYNERVDLSGGEVALVGVLGAEGTVIDGIGLDGPVLTLGAENQAATVVEGFTITHGSPQRTTSQYTVLGSIFELVRDAGAGVYASGARATLRGLVITDNHIADPELDDDVAPDGRPISVDWVGLGGGVFSEGGTLVMERCRLEGNSAQQGGGLYSAQALVMQQSSFIGNEATNGGGGLAAADATISLENVLFAGNTADDGPTMDVRDSALILSQITAKDDRPEQATGALIRVERVIGLWSNLLLSAADGDGIHAEGSGSSVSVEGALADLPGLLRVAEPGTMPVVGAIYDVPEFVRYTDNGDATDDDLHLVPDSPGVDAGLSGRDPDGSVADLGAYGGIFGDW